MIDPATLAALVAVLGPALIKVLEKLADKGIVDPALEPLTKNLKAWMMGKYDKAKADKDLLTAMQKSLPSQTEEAKLFFAFSDLKSRPDLAAKVIAATLEMASEDENRIPSKLLAELKLEDKHRRSLATALFNLRKNLLASETYRAAIQYADALEVKHSLAGLRESVEGLLAMMVDSPDGKAVRVMVVTPPPDQRALESRYLTAIRNENTAYALYNQEDTVSPEKMMHLERVYIALNTTDKRASISKLLKEDREEKKNRRDEEAMAALVRGERESQSPASSLRVVMESRRVMLLGDPGSGKSTFAQHLALCLAGARLEQSDHWIQQLTAADVPQWALASFPFPLFIRLRRFAHDQASLPDSKETGKADHLLAHLLSEVKRLAGGDLSPDLRDHFLRLMEAGETLIILDGLDEVSHPNPQGKDAERRKKVAQAISDFTYRRFPESRVLVTCRVKQYPLDAHNEPSVEWKIPGLHVAQLAPFDNTQQEKFIQGWFAELYARGRRKQVASTPENEAHSLIGQVRVRADLQDIAPNPMLLTLMAIIHSNKRLPETLIKLYEEGVERLLWDWERFRALQAGREGESAQDFLASLGVAGLRQDDLEYALAEAVFESHRDREAEIPKAKIEHALRKCFELHYNLSEEDSAKPIAAFITRWLRGRNGLILPATGDESFTTPHKTLREFLAARHLYRELFDDVGWQDFAPQLVKENYDNWRDVFRFAAGMSPHSITAVALDNLCPEELVFDFSTVQAVLLSAEVARDMKASKLKASGGSLGRMVYQRIESHLYHLMRDSDSADQPLLTSPTILSPKTRLDAGLLLDSLDWTPADLYDFVAVSVDRSAKSPTSRKIGDFVLQQTFIAKYPVTNLQYARFIESEDYAKQETWQSVVAFGAEEEKYKPINLGDAAWKWFNDNGGKSRRPEYWDSARFGSRYHLLPVVRLTWYEAAAYCVWLEQHLETLPEYSTLKTQHSKFKIRLPLEPEWIEAAGGEGDGERFAWENGNEKDKRSDEQILMRANTDLSKLEGTSPVGMYLAGKTLSGVFDMSGNVWEWQANRYEKGKEWLAVRGGSWDDHLDDARVAARYLNHPSREWSYRGFRVVALPS